MDGLFRFLLRLFPASFRAEYGDTVLATLAERGREARARGPVARARFALRESYGLLCAALQEWRALARWRGAAPTSSVPGTVLRGSLRQFRRHPLYAFASAGTLALAVGTAAAGFAVVRHAFLDPLPYERDDELVALFTATETWSTSPVSPHVLRDLQTGDAPFAGYAPMDVEGVVLETADGSLQRNGVYVPRAWFTTLGVAPAIGSVWAEGESQAVVVSWRVWLDVLESDPDPIGRTLEVDDVERVVVGVMPEEHITPWFSATDVWLPLDLENEVARLARGARTLSVVARLAPGASAAQVEGYLELFTERMRTEHPGAHDRERWVAVPLRDALVGDTRPALLGVGAAAMLLVLIVGANLAGLSTARAAGLRRQAAVRVALGASRGRLRAERLMDGLTISLLGTAAGVWLGWVIVRVAAGAQRAFLPALPPLSMDVSTAALTAVLGLAIGIVAAVVPHGAVASGEAESLASTRGVAGGRRSSAARAGLVVFQVSLSLVLIVGTGLLVRTVHTLASTELGYRTENVITLFVDLRGPRYRDQDAHVDYEMRALERLAAVPGVRAVGAAVGVPPVGQHRASLLPVDAAADDTRREVVYFSFAPGYMEMMEIPLRSGRYLSPTDDRAAPAVALVNETLARQLWPGADPLGRRILVGQGTDGDPEITVIGVVPDIRTHGPTAVVHPSVFGSTRQFSWPRRSFSVRADAGTEIVPALRAALAEVDPAAPMGRVASVEELVDERTQRHRIVLGALGLLGAVATALAAFGLFAVVSLTSRLRRREYAIRLAVGSDRRRVRWLVMRNALALAVAGTVVGLAAAAAGTRVLAGLLHGVEAVDGATYSAAAALVVFVAVVAAWAPARQAGRVDPLEALQAE